MYTLRRGEDGRLHGPLNKKVYGTFGSRRSALQWARAQATRRGFPPGTAKTVQIVVDGETCLGQRLRRLFRGATLTLDVRHARLRADTPSAKPDGSATADGYLQLDPAHGDAFSASNGITVTITATGGGTQSATWAPEACSTTASGVISCADRQQGATAHFSPAAGAGTGTKYRIRVQLSHWMMLSLRRA